MGSASREALALATQAIHDRLEPTAPSELLTVAGTVASQPALAAALSDASAPAAEKEQLIGRVFPGSALGTRKVLGVATAARWSSTEDFVAGIEQLGLRAAAALAPTLDEELLAIAQLIDSDHELELAIGSKLADTDNKVQLLRSLLSGKVSDDALRYTELVATHPRGRRLSAALREGARVSADQRGNVLALVTVAAPIDATREARLQAALSRNVGQPVKVSTVIDPDVLGGVRVQIADEIIDGSVRRRLDDLRLQLAK